MSEIEKTKAIKELTTTTLTAKKTVKKTEAVIYVGPAIPGVVSTGTVYNNGLTTMMQEVVEELPAIGTLIVPVSKVAETRRLLNIKNTPAAICYEKVLMYNKKGE